MIVVRETKSGALERISGNPTLLSLDGKVRAPLRTILSPTWSDADRAAFGVHVVEPFAVPDGKQARSAPRYEKRDDVAVELREVEDIPAPTPDTRTPEQKMQELAATFGLTIDEMRAVILSGARP